jgi:hypothetical protein
MRVAQTMPEPLDPARLLFAYLLAISTPRALPRADRQELTEASIGKRILADIAFGRCKIRRNGNLVTCPACAGCLPFSSEATSLASHRQL